MKTENAWKTYRRLVQDLQRISPEAEAEARILWTALGGQWPPFTGPIPEHSRLQRILRIRKTGMPLPYILGKTTFLGHPIRIHPGVFIPRVDTESLILAVWDHFPDRMQRLIIVDVGTGTACLAIALAKSYPHARILAVDRSERAITTANENVQAHRLGERVLVFQGDLLEGIAQKTVDLIVSNPPYIPSPDLPTLPPEVQWEPREALDGGPDGLRVIRTILQQAPGVLKPSGRLFMEIAPPIVAQAVALARSQHYTILEVRQDLSGEERVLVLQVPSESRSRRDV